MIDLHLFIDHTLLRADATKSQIDVLCREAIEFDLAAVCVSPYYVHRAFEMLKESRVKVCTVVGFPLGFSTTAIKVEEARKAIDDGAKEIDMVINLSAVKSGDWQFVKNDIESVCTYVHLKNAILKVIIEIGLLSGEEIKHLCSICEEVGVDFIKTSTGVIGRSVTLSDIILLRKLVSSKMKIKASGGIKDRQFALDLIDAGADRIGTSSGVIIIQTPEQPADEV